MVSRSHKPIESSFSYLFIQKLHKDPSTGSLDNREGEILEILLQIGFRKSDGRNENIN
jgi:hypothetical protein